MGHLQYYKGEIAIFLVLLQFCIYLQYLIMGRNIIICVKHLGTFLVLSDILNLSGADRVFL